MRKILFPFDGSESAVRALKYVIELHQAYGGLEVLAVNVQEDPPIYGEYVTAETIEVLREASRESAKRVLETAAEQLKAAGVPYTTFIAHGDVAHNLVALVEERGCKAIIMGTRGLGAFSSLLLGSTTQKVIHLSKVPVTLVK